MVGMRMTMAVLILMSVFVLVATRSILFVHVPVLLGVLVIVGHRVRRSFYQTTSEREGAVSNLVHTHTRMKALVGIRAIGS